MQCILSFGLPQEFECIFKQITHMRILIILKSHSSLNDKSTLHLPEP